MKLSTIYSILFAACAAVGTLNAADAKAPAPMTAKQAVQAVQKALQARDAAKIGAARAELAKVLARDDVKPEDKVRAHFQIAQSLLQLKQNDGAVAEWNKVLTLKDATPADKVNVHNTIADFYIRQKKNAEAQAEWDKILTLDGASAEQKLAVLYRKADASFRSNFPNSGSHASYFTKGIEGALAIYTDAAKMPDLTNLQKIELARRTANCLLELMKVNEANNALSAAAALPGLTPEERATAQFNLAGAYSRELEKDKALALCREILKAGDAAGKVRLPALNMACGIIRATQGDAAGKAFLEQNSAPESVLKNYLSSIGDYDLIIKDEKAKLADPKNMDRAAPLRQLVSIAFARDDEAMLKNIVEKIIPEQIAAVEKMNLDEARKARQIDAIRAVVARMMPSNTWGLNGIRGKSPKTFAFALSYVLADSKYSNVFILRFKADEAAAKGDPASALTYIERILAIPNLPAKDAFSFQWMRSVIKDSDPVPAVKKLVNASGDEKKQPLMAKTLQQAAQFALKCGFEAKAKKLWAARADMLVKEEKRSLPCTFIENGPKTITDFISCAYVKNPKNLGVLDRKYGDNLKFLLGTDAAITNRQITADAKAAKPTRFAATCDEEGVYLFFIMPATEERIRNIRSGYAGFGGFEMYLAYGYDQPYQCYLTDTANPGKSGFFRTQYDNRGHRHAERDTNTTFATAYGKDTVYFLVKVDWSGVMNGIPVNGTKWEFEPILWDRGGWSWGGSKSVHNRSSFGDLVFANMTAANRTRIKHRLLAIARNTYRASLSERNGCLEQWMDPELGDQAFYFKAVEPLRKKLDAAAGAIKADMSDADINRIFDESYELMINIKFVLQDLRREYLAEQFVTEE